MDKLIQPLSDVLKQNPDSSANIIAISGTVFLLLSALYVASEQREKKALQAEITLQKERNKAGKEDNERLKEQEQEIYKMNEARKQMLKELEDYERKLDILQRENVVLQTDIKFNQGRDRLHRLILSIKNSTKSVEEAILKKEDRRNAAMEVRKQQLQRKKTSQVNLFRWLKRRK